MFIHSTSAELKSFSTPQIELLQTPQQPKHSNPDQQHRQHSQVIIIYVAIDTQKNNKLFT